MPRDDSGDALGSPGNPGDSADLGELVAALSAEVERLIRYTATWTPTRWAVATPAGSSRGAVGYSLVREFVELTKRVDRAIPPDAVPPRLPDTALPDQIAVVAAECLDALQPALGDGAPRAAGARDRPAATPVAAAVARDALAAVVAARSVLSGSPAPADIRRLLGNTP